jgi:hypothetical protein
MKLLGIIAGIVWVKFIQPLIPIIKWFNKNIVLPVGQHIIDKYATPIIETLFGKEGTSWPSTIK